MQFVQFHKRESRRILALLLSLTLLLGAPIYASAETVPAPPPGETEQGGENIPLIPLVPATPGDTGQEDGSIPLIPLVPATPIVPDSTPEEGAEEKPPANDALTMDNKAVDPGVQADSPQAQPDQQPTVTIEQRLIVDELTGEPNGIVEVALRVETPGTETLRAVGAHLKFNSDVLSPQNWDGSKPIAGTAKYSGYFAAKKSDKVSGALGLVGGTAAGGIDGANAGLFYLEAESAVPVALNTSGGEVLAVVRFSYDQTTTHLTYKNNEIVEITNNTNPDNPVTAPISLFSFVDETPDVDCFVPTRTKQALWYEAGDGADGLRFYCVPGYDPLDNTTYTQVTVGGQSIDKPNTSGKCVLAHDETAGDYSYLTNHLNFGDKVLPAQTSGPSYDKSGSGITLGDVRAVVALSWSDEFIGSAVVAAGAKPTDVAKQIDGLTGILFENYDNTLHPSLETGTAVDINTMYDASTNSAQYPLTCHKGYNFAGWIIVDATTSSEEWTSYDTSEEAACLAKLATPKQISDAAKNGVVYLKAAYVGNVTLNYGQHISGADLYFYSVSELKYGRIGAATTAVGNYTISFKIDRKNSEGYGVSRMKEPFFRLKMTISGESLYMKYDLQDTDSQVFQVVVPRNLQSFEYAAADNKASDVPYILAAIKSTTYKMFPTLPGTHPEQGQGFITEGTLGYILEQGKKAINAVKTGTVNADWDTTITTTPELGVDLPFQTQIDDIANQTSASRATRRESIARNRILLYIAARGTEQLAAADVQAAIEMNTQNDITYTTDANYLGFRVSTMELAHEIKRAPVSVEEIKRLCTKLSAVNRLLTVTEIKAELGIS